MMMTTTTMIVTATTTTNKPPENDKDDSDKDKYKDNRSSTSAIRVLFVFALFCLHPPVSPPTQVASVQLSSPTALKMHISD